MPRRIYKKFGRIVKEEIRKQIEQLLTYAGIREEVDSWLGIRVLIMFLLGIAAGIAPWALFKYMLDKTPATTTQEEIVQLITTSLLAFLSVFLMTGFIIYMHLYYIIDDRTKRIESVLPDYLFIMSANLRSGMTAFNAFRLAALPHFGPLKEEVDYVSSKAITGTSLSRALMELSQRVNSDVLRRTITFFDKGIKSGGKMAELLEVSADEMRKIEALKKEMRIQTKSYMIFIVFIIVFIIPLLLSISSQFITVMIAMKQQQASVFTGSETVGILSILKSEIKIAPEFIDFIALATLLSITFLVSMFIGVIGEGKLLYGIKYFPIVALLSLVLYASFRFIVSSMLSMLT
ncbi:MAG: type II secretion system F family protein [Candidatus Micrarchaeia archaeon]